MRGTFINDDSALVNNSRNALGSNIIGRAKVAQCDRVEHFSLDLLNRHAMAFGKLQFSLLMRDSKVLKVRLKIIKRTGPILFTSCYVSPGTVSGNG